MAWQKTFDYKTDAEKYLEAEEKRKKYEKKIKGQEESILYKGSDAYEKWEEAGQQPVPYQGKATGMDETSLKYPVGGDILAASKRIQEIEIGYERVLHTYEANKMLYFPGLKMPNFSKTKKEKTSKVSTKDVNNYRLMLRQFGAVPFKPVKVYKFKEKDPETKAEVVVQQKEIEVIGENKHNYFYVKGGQLGSIAKSQVSPQKLEQKELELQFMERINQIARAKEKHETLQIAGDNLLGNDDATDKTWLERAVDGILQQIGMGFGAARGYEMPDEENLQKMGKGELTGEKINPEAYKDVPKSALYGFAHEGSKLLDKGVSAAMEYSLEKSGPYVQDEEYYKEQTYNLGTKKGKKKLEKTLESQKKMKTQKLPVGYDKAYDVEAAGGTKEEIAAVKEEIDNKVRAKFMGKKADWKQSDIEKDAETTGRVIEAIAEFVITHKVSSALIPKFDSAAKIKKVANFVMQNASHGALYGALQGLKEDDADSWSVLKSAVEEAATFTAGGSATKTLSKFKPVTTSGAVGKRLLQGTFWSAGAETARIPFLEKEEKTLEATGKRILTGAAMGAAFEGVSGFKGLSKQLDKNRIMKIKSNISKNVINKYNLNKSIKGMSPEQQDIVVKETTHNLLADVGKKVKKQVGSTEPDEIVRNYLGDSYSGDIIIKNNLISEKQFAKVKMIQNPDGTIKDVEINYNPKKTPEEIAGATLHEIKHIQDVLSGGTLETGKRIKKPKTVYDLLANQGHHSGMDNFEIKYLEESIASFDKEVAFGKIKKTPGGDTYLIETGEPIESEMSVYERSKKAIKSVQPKGTVDLGTDNVTVWKLPKGSKKESAKDVYTFMINENMPLEQLGKSTKHRVTNYIKHHGTAHMINTSRLVGRDGRALSNRNFVELLDAGKNNVDYDNYLKLKLHLDRMNVEGSPKPVFFKDDKPLSKKETNKMIAELDTKYPEFSKYSNELYQNIDDFSREWMRNLVAPKNLDKMRDMYQHYVTLARINPGGKKNAMSNRISAQVIKAAAGGKQNVMPIAYSLPKYVNGVVRADRKNSIYLTMAENIINSRGKMNKYATIVNPDKIKVESVKSKIDALTKLDDGVEHLFMNMEDQLIADKVHGNFLIALEQGRPITMQIHDDRLWKNLQNLNTIDASEAQKIMRKVKGGQEIFKAVWTKYNPIFWGFRNILRDTPTSFIQSKNPVQWIPSMMKSTADVLRSSYPISKITGKAKLYERYKAMGNEQSNYIKTEMAMTPTKARKLLNFVAGAGSSLENIPRYAEFRSTYKKWKPKIGHEAALEKASYEASEITVNFARKGPGSRAIDTIVPYGNARIQGVDKTVRTLAERPISTIMKALGVVTMPTVIFYMLGKNINPEGYDNLPNHVKDNYYPIPLTNGNFLKVPKNNLYATAFSNLFERVFSYMEGNPDSFSGLGESTTKQIFVPSELLTSDFLGPARNILTGANKDYFGREIVPQSMLSGQSKRSPENQYDESTSEPSKSLGKTIKMSPKQIDYLIKSYSGIIGSIYFAATVQDDLYGRSQAVGLTTSSSYGKKEMKKYEERDKAATDVTDFEIEHGIKDIRTKARESGITSSSEINWEIENKLSTSLYEKWQKLKEKRKEKQEE